MHADFDADFVRMVKDYFDFQHRVLVTRLEHQRQQLIHDELLQAGVANRDEPIQATSSNGNAPVQLNRAPIQNMCAMGGVQQLTTPQGIIRERSISPLPQGGHESGANVSNAQHMTTTRNVNTAAALADSNISSIEPSQFIQGDGQNKPTQSKSHPLISYQFGTKPSSNQQNQPSVAQHEQTSKEAPKNSGKSAKKRGPKKRKRNETNDALPPKDDQKDNAGSKLWADDLFSVPSRNKRRLVDTTGDAATAVCELDMRK